MDTKKIINVTLTAVVILLLVFVVIRINDSKANPDDGKIPVDIVDDDKDKDKEEEVPLTYDDNNNYVAPVINSIPSITLVGDEEVTVEINDEEGYTDLGATAIDSYYGDITNSIVVVNPVDITVLGDYEITYNVTNGVGNAAEEIKRIVHVVDTIAPTIEALEEDSITLEASAVAVFNFDDLGISVKDNSLEDIIPTVTYKFQKNNSGIEGIMPEGTVPEEIKDVLNISLKDVGEYYLTINAKDSSGNEADEFSYLVIVEDTTAPVITFSREGSTLTDNGMGNVTITYDDVSPAIVGYIFIDREGLASIGITNINVTTLPQKHENIVSLKDFVGNAGDNSTDKEHYLLVKSKDNFGNESYRISEETFSLNPDRENNFSIKDSTNILLYFDKYVLFNDEIIGFERTDINNIELEYYKEDELIAKRKINLDEELEETTTSLMIKSKLNVIEIDDKTIITSPYGFDNNEPINSVKLIVTTYNNGIYTNKFDYVQEDVETDSSLTWQELLLHTISSIEVNEDIDTPDEHYIEVIAIADETIELNKITSLKVDLLKDDEILATNTLNENELELLLTSPDGVKLDDFITKFNINNEDTDKDTYFELELAEDNTKIDIVPNQVQITIETITETITNIIPVSFTDEDILKITPPVPDIVMED